MTDNSESGSMNFDTYFNEDGEPQLPYDWSGPDEIGQDKTAEIWDIDRAHEAAGCTCRSSARCLNCIERDALTKGASA